MEKTIKIQFPKSFWHISEQIGYARSVINSKNDRINTIKKYDRGEKNKYVDTIGILGELIAIDYLTNNNIQYKATKLLDFEPSKEADIIVNGKRIDIKASKKSKYKTVLVNKEAHQKGKGIIDLYWFVYVLDEVNAQFFFFDYNEVSQWDSRLMKYTEAYYKKVIQ